MYIIFRYFLHSEKKLVIKKGKVDFPKFSTHQNNCIVFSSSCSSSPRILYQEEVLLSFLCTPYHHQPPPPCSNFISKKSKPFIWWLSPLHKWLKRKKTKRSKFKKFYFQAHFLLERRKGTSKRLTILLPQFLVNFPNFLYFIFYNHNIYIF